MYMKNQRKITVSVLFINIFTVTKRVVAAFQRLKTGYLFQENGIQKIWYKNNKNENSKSNKFFFKFFTFKKIDE